MYLVYRLRLSEKSSGSAWTLETDRSIWKKSLSKPVSFTEPQIFINHCLLTKIYVERGETLKWTEERKRERGR